MNVSVSLTPELMGLIKTKVASGRYTSTSEVIREALRLLERADQREAEELTRLRHAWQEGAQSADAGPLDFAQLKAEARASLPPKG
jgi:antitoxin ParD1/3/4